MIIPQINSDVEVTLDGTYVNSYLLNGYKHISPKVQTIVGKVIPTPKWMDDVAFTMIDQYGQTRYIPAIQIISIDGKKIEQPKSVDNKTMTVISSKTGESYKLRFDGQLRRWSCTCPGFQFRKKCRHIIRVAE